MVDNTITKEKHPGRVAQGHKLVALMRKRKEEMLQNKPSVQSSVLSTVQSTEQSTVLSTEQSSVLSTEQPSVLSSKTLIIIGLVCIAGFVSVYTLRTSPSGSARAKKAAPEKTPQKKPKTYM